MLLLRSCTRARRVNVIGVWYREGSLIAVRQPIRFATAAAVAHEEDAVEAETVEVKAPTWNSFQGKLNPLILETMQKTFKYERLSKVQEEIISRMPLKTDILVRSKTGTGKTLAFLVPALQRTLDHFEKLGLEDGALRRYANKNASVFIITPTRELANQIATEIRRLVTVKGSNMKALCLVGGDSKREQLKLMRRERNDFIVGTPGRLVDMMTNDPDFRDLVKGVHTLVLDEADTLLEMNFKVELDTLVNALPERRQTYMFSATVSRDIQRIVRRYLMSDHEFINTVSATESDVHPHVKQKYMIRDASEHLRVVLSLIISRQLLDKNSKVIVFLPTTKMTILYAQVFKVLRRLYPNEAFQQFDIHSARTQDSRSKMAKLFREAGAGSVLFTTDVSARGVDYPGVSLVIQVGSPQSRDLYVHRVGRTGRAGRDGDGVLILAPFERNFVRTLGKDIPISQQELPDSDIALGPAQSRVFDLMRRLLPPDLLTDAFLSTGGAYIPRARDLGIRKEEVIEGLQSWYKSFNSESQIPQFSRNLLGNDRPGRSFGRERSYSRSDSQYSRSPRRDNERPRAMANRKSDRYRSDSRSDRRI